MAQSVCPQWPTDITGQTVGERNEVAGSYTTAGDMIPPRMPDVRSGKAGYMDAQCRRKYSKRTSSRPLRLPALSR
jgi:hypothetical protein